MLTVCPWTTIDVGSVPIGKGRPSMTTLLEDSEMGMPSTVTALGAGEFTRVGAAVMDDSGLSGLDITRCGSVATDGPKLLGLDAAVFSGAKLIAIEGPKLFGEAVVVIRFVPEALSTAEVALPPRGVED
jgi:hypothetical protein